MVSVEKAVSGMEWAGESDLPRWDLTVLYPGLDSPEFVQGMTDLASALADLEAQTPFPHEHVTTSTTVSAAELTRIDDVLSQINGAAHQYELLASFIYGHVSTNSRDDVAQARMSELTNRGVTFDKVMTSFCAWVGSLPIEDVIARSEVAARHAYALRNLHISAQHLMSAETEALAAELAPSAATAWSRLHGNLWSQLSVSIELDGEAQHLPMSEIRNLAMRTEREVRQRAWQAELAAWEANALPFAAAINGVKGNTLVLGRRRDWADPLEETLFQSGIDREILDGMMQEARAAFPDFRRYMRLKAELLGVDALTWYDLFAPVGRTERTWSWDDARDFIAGNFGTFSERMAGLANRAYSERWFDAEPRDGKSGGGFCMSFIEDRSLILVNYAPTYDAVTTVAHELGHAYHNLNLAGLTSLQRDTPMILAETASTFCETIIKEAALADAPATERLYILEQWLQGMCQIVVDISSRFNFESALFAARAERELSIRELNELMLAAQQGTYGDGLDPNALHPYMWAVKTHYYRTGESFYNFPYLFGLLFGLGLYALSQREPENFPARYDALLSQTGRATAADLAAAFGLDLRAPEFWRMSLDLIRADIDRFEELVDREIASRPA